eukprot:scaffold3416_cov17-Tisochrysis_lutea.AAC.1
MGDGERVPGSGGGEHVWLKSVGVCPRRHWSCRASWELKSAICSKKNMCEFNFRYCFVLDGCGIFTH